jgi:hypothetical protein
VEHILAMIRCGTYSAQNVNNDKIWNNLPRMQTKRTMWNLFHPECKLINRCRTRMQTERKVWTSRLSLQCTDFALFKTFSKVPFFQFSDLTFLGAF